MRAGMAKNSELQPHYPVQPGHRPLNASTRRSSGVMLVAQPLTMDLRELIASKTRRKVEGNLIESGSAACARNAVEFPAFACTQATERLTAPSTLDEIQTFNHGTSERGRERDS
jgi:hypothetical protein